MNYPIKANLNKIAAQELREIAQELGISESEVLRRGLAIMRYYSQALKKDPKTSLMIRKGDTVSELIVI